MASDHGKTHQDPESFQPTAPPRKEHGCFYYGCITAVVLAVLMAVGIGVVGFLGYRAIQKVFDEYTSPTPTQLPKITLSAEERKALDERADAFKKALDANEDTEPLVLTGDELNALIADKTKHEDRVYFTIDKDTLKGQVSLPLDEVPLPGLKGRFFNGDATFHVSLKNGKLVVTVDSAAIKEKPLPEEFMKGFRDQNLAKDMADDKDLGAVLDKLESIEVKDGKIIIKAKPKAERVPEPAKEAEKKEEGSPEAAPAPKAKDDSPPAEKKEAPAPSEKEPAEKAAPKPEQEKGTEKSGDASVYQAAERVGFEAPLPV